MENKKAPSREQEMVTVPLSYMKDKLLYDSNGELLIFTNEELEVVKDVLNVIGEHGYSIKSAYIILELCKIAAEECTYVEKNYVI